MFLNRAETIPLTLLRGSIVFHRTSTWSQRGWGLCSRGLCREQGKTGANSITYIYYLFGFKVDLYEV